MSRVSVIIPARDAAATLADVLRSLALQTRRPDEIVVVDNESRDATATIAREAGARVVEAVGRRGPGPVRNAGAALATGDVLAFLDADCIAPPEWLATLIGPIDADPSTLAVAGTAHGRAPRTLVEIFQETQTPAGWKDRVSVFRGMKDAVVTNSLAVRAAAFRAAGGFDERLRWMEDVAFPQTLLAACPGGTIARIPDAAVAHAVPSTLAGSIRRVWKYGFWSAMLFTVLWRRKLLVEGPRFLRIDSDRLPVRFWLQLGPDKVVVLALLPGLFRPVGAAFVLIPLLYYWMDLMGRARRRGIPLGPLRAIGVLGVDLVWHFVWTLGRLAGSWQGRALCV